MGCCQGVSMHGLVLVSVLLCCYGVSRVLWVVSSKVANLVNL